MSSDISFRTVGETSIIIRNGIEKNIPKEILLEIYQMVLGHLSPNRDYSNISSNRKLLRIIDIEFEPDDSEEEKEVLPINNTNIKNVKNLSVKTDEDEEVEVEEEEEKTIVKNKSRKNVRKPPLKPIPPKSDTEEEDE